jgi:epoxyqueuosine reductase
MRVSGERQELTQLVKSTALECGFDAVGICAANRLEPERERYLSWLEQGRHGDMGWITADWIETASHAGHLLPKALSVICVALSYGGRPAAPTPSMSGRIARYAQGRDYHVILGERLKKLADDVAGAGGQSRPFVDTAPTMDKALAVRAGIGWQGRNTMVLSKRLGSFTYLGGLVTDLDLEPDHAQSDGCGACRLCARACPTGALAGDYTIDSRLCISYLTIEHRGPIPRSLRSQMGAWVFGCDICQDVCPPVTRLQDERYPELQPDRVRQVRSLVGNAQSN